MSAATPTEGAREFVESGNFPTTARDPVEQHLIERLRTGRAALPVLPQVAAMALRLASDPEARIEELGGLVDTDPPIAARFLSVANSVAYWRGFLASSTHAAIVRLGLANTRDLLLQVVYASHASGLKRFHNSVQKCFQQSVMAAVASRVAREQLRIECDYDYMAGLLHDIGEARIYRILDDIPKDVRIDSRLVRHLLRRYHEAAGAEVAMAWQLPSEIVDACAAHHSADGPSSPHVRLVMIADAIVEALKAGDNADALEVSEAMFDDLEVSPEEALRLVTATREAVGQTRP